MIKMIFVEDMVGYFDVEKRMFRFNQFAERRIPECRFVELVLEAAWNDL